MPHAGRPHPAAGGGHWVLVSPERLDTWLADFAGRHGPTSWTATPRQVTVTAADGALAECEVPLAPLTPDPDVAFGGLIPHVRAERTVGVLLVRLGGHAAGVFAGPRLVASQVGSRPVHGRSAAGGTSQHRFARRREGQVRVAHEAAAGAAARVLVPAAPGLEALVVGGDRRAVEAVLGDVRVAALRSLIMGRFLEVPDPRLRVLQSACRLARAVRIRLVEPPAPAGDA